MKISVITPCYNSGPAVERTVESALAQTVRPFEIVLLDDASTDDTWTRLEGLRSRHGEIIRIFRRPKNLGYGLGPELASLARGDWLARLDHDDLWRPEKLEKQVQAHKRHPDADVIHTDGWNQPGDEVSSRVLQETPRYLGPADPYEALYFGNFILHSSALYRREIYRKIRSAPEPANLACVDYELWLRMSRSGVRFVRVPEPLVTRRLVSTGQLASGKVWWLRLVLQMYRDYQAFEREKPRLRPRQVRRRIVLSEMELIHELLISQNPAFHEEAAERWIGLLRNWKEANRHRLSLIRLMALARSEQPRLGQEAGYPRRPWRPVILSEADKRKLLEEWDEARRDPGRLDKIAQETGRLFREPPPTPPFLRMYKSEILRGRRIMFGAWNRLERQDRRWGWIHRLGFSRRPAAVRPVHLPRARQRQDGSL